MREIKFRAWNYKDKEMLPPADVWGFGCGDEDYWGDTWCEANELILMQYTGLKDKNGKEIYEGDIFINYITKIKGVVSFQKGCFVWGKPKGYSVVLYSPSACFNEEKCEVLGNIYNNPELLGG